MKMIISQHIITHIPTLQHRRESELISSTCVLFGLAITIALQEQLSFFLYLNGIYIDSTENQNIT